MSKQINIDTHQTTKLNNGAIRELTFPPVIRVGQDGSTEIQTIGPDTHFMPVATGAAKLVMNMLHGEDESNMTANRTAGIEALRLAERLLARGPLAGFPEGRYVKVTPPITSSGKYLAEGCMSAYSVVEMKDSESPTDPENDSVNARI